MKANFLTVDITPTRPVPLAGYASRRGSFKQVDSRLEANITAFPDHGVVLGSVDTLFVGEAVRRGIAERARIPLSRLMLVSSSYPQRAVACP